MQTFLPYADFVETARCLDRQRLGKQRVENVQIMKALLNPGTSRWENHPAVRMWDGYLLSLLGYHAMITDEWTRRGYKDTTYATAVDLLATTALTFDKPRWLGDERFHASHRSNLLRKNREHYGVLGWAEPDDLPYFWPTKEGYAKPTG